MNAPPRFVVPDSELSVMLAQPVDVPGEPFERKGLLMEAGKQIVAAVWQKQGLPRTQLALRVNLEMEWQLALACGQLVFILFDLDSTETDASGRNGLALFCSIATFEGTYGAGNKSLTMQRGVLRLHVKPSVPGKEETMRLGWLMVRQPETNR